MNAEIISIGTELLMGEIVNTNAQYISNKLKEIGIDVHYQTTVGDNENRIIEAIDIASKRVDIIITTGGLGPTIDDRTKEVVSKICNKKMVMLDDYYAEIERRYKERNFEISSGAKKEASILEDSIILHNTVGLAPGFAIKINNSVIYVLPGPPKEMTVMFDDEVIPMLKKESDYILYSEIIEIKGVPEGKIDDDLKDYFNMTNPTVAPYAKDKCIHVRVAMKGKNEDIETIKKEVSKIVNEIKERYKDYEVK